MRLSCALSPWPRCPLPGACAVLLSQSVSQSLPRPHSYNTNTRVYTGVGDASHSGPDTKHMIMIMLGEDQSAYISVLWFCVSFICGVSAVQRPPQRSHGGSVRCAATTASMRRLVSTAAARRGRPSAVLSSPPWIASRHVLHGSPGEHWPCVGVDVEVRHRLGCTPAVSHELPACRARRRHPAREHLARQALPRVGGSVAVTLNSILPISG